MRGFTLTEFLVTLSIFMLLVGAAFASFRSTNQHTELAQAAEDLRQAIYETRALALAPATSKAPGSPGYLIRLTGERDWQIVELEPVDSKTGGERIIRQGSLGSRTRYVTPLTVSELRFDILDRGRVTDASGQLRQSLTHVVSGEQMTLVVSAATGQVEITEP